MKTPYFVALIWCLGLVAGLLCAVLCRGRFEMIVRHDYHVTLSLPLKPSTPK